MKKMDDIARIAFIKTLPVVASAVVFCGLVGLNARVEHGLNNAQNQLDEFENGLPNYMDSIKEFDAKNAQQVQAWQNVVNFAKDRSDMNINTDSLQNLIDEKKSRRAELFGGEMMVRCQKKQYLDSIRHAHRFGLMLHSDYSLAYKRR